MNTPAENEAPAKHTAGPWEISDESTRRNVFQIETEDGYAIADIRDYNHDPQNKANARLIAAAPDMLAALKGTEGEHCDDPRLFRLGWLDTLLVGIRDNHKALELLGDDDPQAFDECLSYCRALVTDGMAAITKAQGGPR